MNKYEGDNFEDFLKEEGIFEEVTERAKKRLLVLEIGDMVNAACQNKTAFIQNKNTDLVELNHYLFDLDNMIISSELLQFFTLEAKKMKTNPLTINEFLLEIDDLPDSILNELC